MRVFDEQTVNPAGPVTGRLRRRNHPALYPRRDVSAESEAYSDTYASTDTDADTHPNSYPHSSPHADAEHGR